MTKKMSRKPPTKIILCVNEDGTRAPSWFRPDHSLFEILDGPRAGTRGSDVDLAGEVGRVVWDRTVVSRYDSGKLVNVL